MAIDDGGQMNDQNSPGDLPPESGAPVTDKNNEGSLEGGLDHSSRMSAAKAFYRAMYAGEEVEPEQFGMGVAVQGQSERTGPCASCQNLKLQLDEAQLKQAEAENLYKRMAADFENYRRRIDRERDEFQVIGIQRAIESVLPALDDLDRAQMSLQTVSDPKSITDSFNVVHSRFQRCLEQIGVKPLDVIGKLFDPRFHEPVQEIPSDEFPEGAVMHELRRGYVFGEKVLRPSLVNVASAKEPHIDQSKPKEEGETSFKARDLQSPSAKTERLPTEASKPEADIIVDADMKPALAPTEDALTGKETSKPDIIDLDKTSPESSQGQEAETQSPTKSVGLDVIDADSVKVISEDTVLSKASDNCLTSSEPPFNETTKDTHTHLGKAKSAKKTREHHKDSH